MGIMTNGVAQWLFQRISNAVFVVFGLVVLSHILSGNLSYETLNALLASTAVRIYLLVTLLLACANAILAGWQIAGDYAEKFNLPAPLILAIVIVVSVAYFVWGLLLI